MRWRTRNVSSAIKVMALIVHYRCTCCAGELRLPILLRIN
nr:MAG TPA: Protein of unknown function (DUF1062) [Inoviridae sp.]